MHIQRITIVKRNIEVDEMLNPEYIILDPEEQEIEDHFEEYSPLPEAQKNAVIEDFRRATRKSRTKVASFRRGYSRKGEDRSRGEGLPNQTFIQSVVYKYITGRLVDEKELRLAAKVLAEKSN